MYLFTNIIRIKKGFDHFVAYREGKEKYSKYSYIAFTKENVHFFGEGTKYVEIYKLL